MRNCKDCKYYSIDTSFSWHKGMAYCEKLKNYMVRQIGMNFKPQVDDCFEEKTFICEICHKETPIHCEGAEPNTCAMCMPIECLESNTRGKTDYLR